ncbi:Uncharacterized protein TCAP_03434 [Tolypocladium capitatum]|uniref:Uncharacterized protein n=1 Tax=Tolypocladium capitatum TaxID=45235 RepID=A0A2K3QGL4_9HYPO|nr:Uncharacterized protein TCAP_03434 [Tolypocladium capitatum]
MGFFISPRRLWGLLGIIWVAICILPFINGLIEGRFLFQLLRQQREQSRRNLRSSIRTAQMLDRASIPGFKSAHDARFPPYYIPQLRDPTGWWERLGLTRFDVDVTNMASTPDLELITALARMELYREERRHEDGAPWHHWVFASAQAGRMEGVFYDEWDEAFDDLLRHHHAKPTPGNASFHFVSCPDRYFCGAWFVKAPALLHLTTEAPDLFDAATAMMSTSHKEVPGYDNVTVRVMEFPIADPRRLGLAPGVFPSPFNQLRAVTADQYGWQRHPPYRRYVQVWRRLREHAAAEEQAHPRTYGLLVGLEKGLLTGLDLRGSIPWQVMPRMTGTFVSTVLHVMCERGLVTALEYLLQAPGAGHDDEKPGSLQPDDAMDEILILDFVEAFPDIAGEIVRSSADSGEAWEKMKDAIRSFLSTDEEKEVQVRPSTLSGYYFSNTSQDR